MIFLVWVLESLIIIITKKGGFVQVGGRITTGDDEIVENGMTENYRKMGD